MKRKRRITALDISDIKIAGVIAEYEPSSGISIVKHDVIYEPCLQNGLVTDIAKTASLIKKFVKQLHHKTRYASPIVSINISGENLALNKSKTAVLIGNARGIITSADLREVISQAHIQGLSLDRKVIETIISRFIVDDNINVADPLRMHARKLAVELSIISGLLNHINNLKKALNQSGYYIKDIVADPIADSWSVLTEKERQEGVVLINIGHCLSYVSIFKNSKLEFMKVIKRGGKDITKSISQSLSISFEYAEELKKRFGCEHSNSGARQEIVLKRDEATFKTIDKSVITAAASQAACNVFENIYSIFKDSPVFEQNSSKVVLTGATALMDSMIEILQSKFNLTLEVGNPRGFKIDNQLNSPSWSTCLGVVKKTFLGACTHPSSRALSLHKYLVQKLSDFMTDYF